MVYIYIHRTFITRRVHGRFYGLDFKNVGNGRLGKLAIDTLVLSMMKKMAADSMAQGKNLDLHGPAWLIAVRERSWSFIQTTLQFINTLALDVIQVLDSRNCFQSCYGKHSSLHVCSRSLSFGQRVDGWIF